MRRRLTATIAALALALTVFTVPVSAAENSMYRVGAKDRTVKVGQVFELEVKEGPALDDHDIKWSSSNTSIVKYAENDRYDDEMEFKALKKGSVKITAHNLATGGKLVYNITVKPKSGNVSIYRVGNKARTYAPGREFELKVTKGDALKSSNIKWTIGNTNIVKFDDDDRYGLEVELEARKVGSTTVTAHNLHTGGKLVYNITVKSSLGPYNMARIGNATKYVGTYDDIELEVRKGSSLSNSQIKWTIGNTNLLRFEDGDNYGKEVELEAKGKSGTTKVTAHNLHTGGKIVYTVKVSPAYDD